MATIPETLAKWLRPMGAAPVEDVDVIAAKAAADKASPDRGQKSTSGLYTIGDVLIMSEQLEYLDDMRPPKRFETIDKMLADPSVWAAAMAWIMPMLSTTPEIKPGDQEPESVEIADFMRDDLFNLSTDYQQIRYESLMCIAYGVTIHELVWEFREDKKWHMRDMSYVPPASIYEQGWHLEEDGSAKGVSQNQQDGPPEFIPIKKLLVHTHGQLGANLTGRSALRAAYKPWWYKDKLEAISAVAVERNAAGIPVGKQLGDSHKTTALSRYIETVLKAVRTHQAAFVRETSEFEFRLEGIKGATINPHPFLVYHSIEIFRSMLAQHVALGGTDTGSWALADSDVDFLVMALEAVLAARDAAFNRHVIPRWIEYNWKNVPRASYPKLTHTPLNTRKLKDWFAAVTAAVDKGVLPSSDRMERMAEDLLGIEAPTPTTAAPQTQEELDAEKPADGTEPEPTGVAASRPPVRVVKHAAPLKSVGMMAEAGVRPNFVRMADGLDNARDRLIASVGALQAKQAKRLTAIGMKLIKAGDAEGVAAMLTGAQVAAAKRFVPFDEEEALFAEELEGAYGDGFNEIWYELRDQGVPAGDIDAPATEDTDRDRGMIAVWATVGAALLADRMAGAWAGEALRQIGSGVADERALFDMVSASTGAQLKSLAGGYVNRAFGFGRGAFTKANEKVIDSVIVTAVMDGRTCDPCGQEDGKVYSAKEAPTVPLDVCQGGDMCRCQTVPVVNDMADRSEPYEQGEAPPEWF